MFPKDRGCTITRKSVVLPKGKSQCEKVYLSEYFWCGKIKARNFCFFYEKCEGGKEMNKFEMRAINSYSTKADNYGSTFDTSLQ